MCWNSVCKVSLLGCTIALTACGGLIGGDTSLNDSQVSAGGVTASGVNDEDANDEQFAAEDKLPLTTAQLETSWRALAVPSIERIATPQGIVRAFNGFLALSERPRGDGNGSRRYDSETALFFSFDGIHWEQRTLGPKQERQNLTDMACSSQLCVIAGRDESSLVSYFSTDGEIWQEGTPFSWGGNVQALRFAGEYFFTSSLFTGEVLRSQDGATWQQAIGPLPRSQGEGFWDLAYGNGLYVAGGSSSSLAAFTYQSVDGKSWQRGAPVDVCNIERRCSFLSLDFVNGAFYGWRVQSVNGENWTRGPNITMRGIAGTSLLSYGQDGQLHAWDSQRGSSYISLVSYETMAEQSGTLETEWASSWNQDPRRYSYPPSERPPTELEFPWPDGLTCRNRRCVIREGELFLIP